MKMKVTQQPCTFNNYNNNGYYDSLVQSWLSAGGARILGWWLHEEHFYFSCPIKNDPIFKGGTPLILIDRNQQYCGYDDEYIGEWSEEKEVQAVIDYPFTILTLGSDDGNKGWLFKTEQDALDWYEEFSEIINTFSNDFESGWAVLHYFQNNQVYMN